MSRRAQRRSALNTGYTVTVTGDVRRCSAVYCLIYKLQVGKTCNALSAVREASAGHHGVVVLHDHTFNAH